MRLLIAFNENTSLLMWYSAKNEQPEFNHEEILDKPKKKKEKNYKQPVKVWKSRKDWGVS